MEMTKEMIEIGKTLSKIDRKVFINFNVAFYVYKHETVKARNKYKKNASGNKVKVGTTYSLTEKGKALLEEIRKNTNLMI